MLERLLPILYIDDRVESRKKNGGKASKGMEKSKMCSLQLPDSDGPLTCLKIARPRGRLSAPLPGSFGRETRSEL